MDPTLKEYLDRMHQDLSNRSDAAVAQGHTLQKSQDALALQLASQSTQIRDLALWQPDLEERFAKLQDTVVDLQHARIPAGDASGGPTAGDTNTPPYPFGGTRGQFGHGIQLSPGGLPTVGQPPPAPPVTVRQGTASRHQGGRHGLVASGYGYNMFSSSSPRGSC